jgi:heme exporter protein A
MTLKIDQLVVYRGERYLFGAISTNINSGEMLTITGRNGVGKSSLLAVLSGLIKPYSGIVSFNHDRDLSTYNHLIAHKDGLKNALTAYENLMFDQALLGEPHFTPDEAIKSVDLVHVRDLPIAYLSAGQRKRVALARLLISKRPLWLLDEPTSALDHTSQTILYKLIVEHRTQGGIVVVATHSSLDVASSHSINLDDVVMSHASLNHSLKVAL